MKYIQYKMILGDPEGADILAKFKPWFSSIKTIDKEYKGTTYYWAFYQLAELGDRRLTLLKFEIWSAWKETDTFESAYPGYVGASCGLFFYFIDVPESWDVLKKQIDTFYEHQKKESPTLLVIGLYDPLKNTKKHLKESLVVQVQVKYIQKINGDLLFIPDRFVDEDMRELFKGFIVYFVKKLGKDFAQDFDLNKELMHLNLFDVRELLIAERRGMTAAELKIKPLSEISEKSKDKISNFQISNESKIKNTIESGTEGNIAIAPNGEKIILETLNSEQIVDLVLKGYKLPSKYYIPRHCPRCGNYNQRMIFEMEDRHLILMDYPRIYGIKCRCGNCGHEWHQK